MVGVEYHEADKVAYGIVNKSCQDAEHNEQDNVYYKSSNRNLKKAKADKYAVDYGEEGKNHYQPIEYQHTKVGEQMTESVGNRLRQGVGNSALANVCVNFIARVSRSHYE